MKLIHFFTSSIIVILLATQTALSAQVSGKILDEDGLPLAFASVIVKGTTLGTSANAEGIYMLNLPIGNYTLVAQYIGYKQSEYILKITADEKLQHNFELKAQGYELKDIIIKSGGEDPAYRIIRNAIKQREKHLKQLESFETSIYLKGVLRNRKTPNQIMGIKLGDDKKEDMNGSMGLDTAGRGVLYLAEQYADYYKKGKQKKLIIHSVKESGDPSGMGMGSVPPVINFYENNVNVLVSSGANDLGFVSPISATALNYYKYKLLGDFKEDERKIYKIRVTPKRNFERCFAGDIYIADEEWAIHSLQLLLTNKQGLDLLDTLKTEQQYIPVDKDLWVIKSQVFYPTINILGFDVSGNFVTVYDNQKVNKPIADSIFNKKITISYQREATKRDSAYWQNLRPVALEMDELRNYDYRDSTYKVDNDPIRRDSIRRKGNKTSITEFFWGGISFTSKDFKRRFSISQALFDVNYNTVEGLNYAPSLAFYQKIDSFKYLNAESQLRYGFANTHFNSKVLLQYRSNSKNLAGKYFQISMSGGKYISQLNNQQPVAELVNTYATLIEQRNYFKIYERAFAGVQVKHNLGTGFSWSASLQFEDRTPLQNVSNFSFVRDKNKAAFTDNLPSEFINNPLLRHQAFIAIAQVNYQPGIRYTQYPDRKVPRGSNAPIFSFFYQKGIANIMGSDVDYDKWSFSIQDEVNLKRMGSFEYRTNIGGFINAKNVTIPDQNHLLGNQYTVAAPYLQSFQLAPYYRYSNQAKLYGTVHLEYFLKGFISNKIPLLRQAHWYFVLGTNTFYVNQSQYYTEAFVGLDNIGYKIFRGIRFDLVKSWDSFNQDHIGLRLGYKLGSAIKVGQQNKASIF